ncbi:hypothetical protein CcaverHIS002_0600920 [Cutaneotrichosporon cavernicola]|uniref:6-methylsalicylate decarboxylase n=1 Tax=Cutaneotrichosporon cavernicola TaxID=279322 RepID=A0AA48QWH6_9TREE|nr:uncharacterized protein CcaverHIS019_0501020 [Cutaneotrichosporon cavernicola]BEI85805.1 hypothetical protein CcaverHIS002_0600920 [Cutaneotrichosporon cavernicola]BEI92474.1 hypothetical protein CcaverHIS019_0501020 [Cutaneotrichosporon cavernicola]BEJ00246.1 hypothetical protein CcaverHIS631_0501030 [Cutaneotrichosporon cavernicola]BEJ08017.1 hypothetical protein CcaverHIS641_0501020 [Cutaneotrichosporon cavernicola]
MKRIDTHVHIIPPSYRAAIDKYGDPSGWVIPAWSLDAALNAATQLGVGVSVMSVTSPGPSIAGPGPQGRVLARACNGESVALARLAPGKIALFGSLPDWNDVDGTLTEIDYVMRDLCCPGVVVMTTYGGLLLGNPKFKPIWERLEQYQAIVFIHPAAVDVIPRLIAEKLPQPIVDYPQATTRTAADLVLTRTFTKDSKFKVILSHAGGTLPWLADRLASASRIANPSMSMAECLEAIRHFYFDVALSTTPTALYGLLQITTPDKILYGSDFPYAPLNSGLRQTTRLDKLLKGEFRSLGAVNSENAERLFGGIDRVVARLGGGNKPKPKL